MFTCRKCGVGKPATDFGTRSDTGKRKPACILCEREWHRAHYERTRDRRLKAASERYALPSTKAKRRAYRAGRRDKDKAWKRNWDLIRNYGIDANCVDATIEAQHGCCPICLAPPKGGKWHVDHDHTTGAVRGVLCPHCNLMLGNAKDNPSSLRRAAEYLEKSCKS